MVSKKMTLKKDTTLLTRLIVLFIYRIRFMNLKKNSPTVLQMRYFSANPAISNRDDQKRC